jgi:hypothetical protein
VGRIAVHRHVRGRLHRVSDPVRRDGVAAVVDPRQFAALIVAGVLAAVIVWSFLNHPMGDPIGIAYFCIANTALPLDVCRHPDVSP